MASIKRFFAKKKLDVKFKKAGSGHTLNDDAQKSAHSTNVTQAPASRQMPTSDSQRAGQAALDRLNRPKQALRGSSDLRHQVRCELEEETKAKLNISSGPKVVENEAVPMVPVILFNCPEIGPVVLPREEMDAHIKEFLFSQYEEESEMSSAVMIHTLNKDKAKVKICVETLSKYLENIIANPGEEKYCKIKVANKIFQERVASLNGSHEFLAAVGFKREVIRTNDEDVEFYRLGEEDALLTERLVSIREVLLAAEPIRPQLDRALNVFKPSPKCDQFTIPPEFYNISPDEIKREHEIRQEAIEKMGMLRTKAMRERDEIKELRRYRYTLIRVRFPDGIILQGTFKATEKLAALLDFVRGSIVNDWVPFSLVTMTGGILPVESTQSLVELGLAPSIILNFSWDEKVMGDIIAAQDGASCNAYLKPELLANIRSL